MHSSPLNHVEVRSQTKKKYTSVECMHKTEKGEQKSAFFTGKMNALKQIKKCY